MKLDWPDILGTRHVCVELRKFYKMMPLKELAQHLGVSVDALRRRLIKCKVQMRSRGGPHFRYPRELLPENIINMSVAQIVQMTGYTVAHARKVRRDLRRKYETRKVQGGKQDLDG